MLFIPVHPTIQQLQEYVAQAEIDRGFADQSAVQECLLLGEEIGELFKAVRASSGIKVDATSTATSVGEELADILNFVVAIANRFQIDLETAYRDKEQRNSSRFRC
jgi:NTP pyrophosphatase (non-canonical NTP hydrolase)